MSKRKTYTDDKCFVCWGTGSQFNDGMKCWHCDGTGYEPYVEKGQDNKDKVLTKKLNKDVKNVKAG